MHIIVNDPNLKPADLRGFCVGWRQPLDPETLFATLKGSYRYIIARDDDGKVIGFANAISDGTFAAYIPLVEVLPENQGAGVGTGIMRELLNELEDFRIVDLMCDPPVQEFYKTLDMIPMVGMRANRIKSGASQAPAQPQWPMTSPRK
jgi:GNAT superfamily N-acetyltransferase